MNPDKTDEVVDAAIDWIVRVAAPEFAQWEAFEDWMAADVVHAQTYWRLASINHDIGPVAAEDTARIASGAMDEVSRRRSGGRGRALAGWGTAAAATIALVFGGFALHRPALRDVAFTTAPGQKRQVVLEDGTRLSLNGGTRLILAQADPRRIRLEAGEALFEVVHDASKPFVLIVGRGRITDMGTSFDVVRDGGEIRVAVSEGSVSYSRGASAVRLEAGEKLRIADDSANLLVGRIETADVSLWRSGRLSFQGAPFSQVAADLTRSLGVHITVAPEAASRLFTGSLSTQGAPTSVAGSAASMLGLRIRRTADGWVLDDGGARYRP